MFDQFWTIYPKKTGHLAAEKKFNALKPEVQKEILNHLAIRVGADKGWEDGFIPLPVTFLNQGRWMDEYEKIERFRPKMDAVKVEICPNCRSLTASQIHQDQCVKGAADYFRATGYKLPTEQNRILPPVVDKKYRSTEQNQRFDAMCGDITTHLKAKGSKVSALMVKEWVKKHFGPNVTIEVGGITEEVVKPSSKYTPKEMTDLMDEITAWAATDLELVLR